MSGLPEEQDVHRLDHVSSLLDVLEEGSKPVLNPDSLNLADNVSTTSSLHSNFRHRASIGTEDKTLEQCGVFGGECLIYYAWALDYSWYRLRDFLAQLAASAFLSPFLLLF